MPTGAALASVLWLSGANSPILRHWPSARCCTLTFSYSDWKWKVILPALAIRCGPHPAVRTRNFSPGRSFADGQGCTPMAFLGGIFLPVELMPVWAQAGLKILPAATRPGSIRCGLFGDCDLNRPSSDWKFSHQMSSSFLHQQEWRVKGVLTDGYFCQPRSGRRSAACVIMAISRN